jgi:hypothetical protein
MKMKLLLVCCAAAGFGAVSLQAQGPSVTIVTGSDAPELESYAASELSGLLKTLFKAEVTVSAGKANDGAKILIFLGTPQSQPAVKAVLSSDLGPQGHIVKSTPKGLVIGGGSPVAVLWAVYDFGYANGMRYLTSGDFPPIQAPAFTLSGYDVAMKPARETRAWVSTQASWGAADNEKLLRQLAKMKFNAVILPDIGKLNALTAIDVTGDIAGRSVFGGAKEFKNPDLTGDPDAAKRLIAGIQSAAEKLGMTTESQTSLTRLTLGQPQDGLLPRMAPLELPAAGFAVEAAIVGDQNVALHFLTHASFVPKFSPDKALANLATPICGEGVSDALSLGFTAIAGASALIEKNDPTFAVPDPKMFMEHYESADPAPAWWAEAKTLYAKGMNEMYRANTRAREGARPWILYHAKRYTFAVHYLTAVESVKKAGLARAAKDEDAWAENLELAVEAMHNALGIYSEVAADQSDRGAIAVLNQYAYRPLLKALEELP